MAKMQLFLLQLLEIIAATALVVLGQSSSGDTMTPNSSLINGQTLISAGGIFQLGFFSPAKDSENGYLGIWYYSRPPAGQSIVAWVANRNRSLNRASSSLNLTSDGNLIIFDGETLVWSTGISTESNSVHLQLLDSGNLLLTTENFSRTLWQSFDHPSDTLLPGMKLGFDLRRNTSWQLVSWRSDVDPSLGNYINRMETHGVAEFIAWNGTTKIYRSGPWSGHGFVGLPQMKNSTLARRVNFTFVSNENEIYYITENLDRSVLSRSVVNTDGNYERWSWDNGEWRLFWSFPADECDHYNLCGRGSVCSWGYYAFSCSCLQGFAPASNGCVREKPLNCSSNQILKVQNVKVPDTENATAYGMMSMDACKRLCLGNCSCVAYAVLDEPNGCVTWQGDLLDLRYYTDGANDLYIRLAESSTSKSNKHVWAITIPVVLGFLLLCCILVATRRRNRAQKQGTRNHIEPSAKGTRLKLQFPNAENGDLQSLPELSNSMANDDVSEPMSNEIDSEHSGYREYREVVSILALGVLPCYDLCTMKAATNDFSNENKLGEGGFGVVYKVGFQVFLILPNYKSEINLRFCQGELQDGQKIAVKKLSRYSSQGPNEFQNELSLIAKLQHRNLVRLLGSCIEGDERLIILEYMENKSLDRFIFDKTKSPLLNWQKRLEIINGIARGLLYLHQDSILRVIHRDLKLSNILLDKDMTPKISDFGIARIFEGDGVLENVTTRPVGTFGYMAPEYLTEGVFSFKSDIFSFGVIVLEILSGKRNKIFSNTDASLNLLGHAYKLWKEGRSLEILDDTLDHSYPTAEILRCIRLGLLCVQDNYEDRPTLTEVVMMLASEDQLLTPLKQPTIMLASSEGGATTKEISHSITGR
ncbi:hypothetical protein ZIOFF_029152 [Zingiber officinale]|uniref:Receptor-like serine/threonine-protein kinase n=1 Tax=Zingiber officinale TaxID=94328 RepID=A0A8J5H0Y7_ZINOF|nr:hypothetical protein ZIOFF_029152 [Zingiber officinale]